MVSASDRRHFGPENPIAATPVPQKEHDYVLVVFSELSVR